MRKSRIVSVIELDEERYHNIKNPKAWENTDIVQVIKSKKVGFLLANLALSSYQKKIAKKLDTAVGQEMLQGIQSAEGNRCYACVSGSQYSDYFFAHMEKIRLVGERKIII